MKTLNLFAGRCVSAITVTILLAVISISAQTTITYQGKLTDASMPVTAVYDFQFRLYNAFGNPLSSAVVVEDISVTDGVFTAPITFPAGSFSTNLFTSRSLEIGVRPGASTGAFTLLTPRQNLTSEPYAAVASSAASADTATTAINANGLGGVAAANYVQTNDTRLTDTRTPTAGSGDYIQNNPSANSQTASFNIFGHGTISGAFNAFNVTASNTLTGSTVSATTQFNIGNNRVLSLSGSNLLVGTGASTVGYSNTSIGNGAGANMTASGGENTFVGDGAGLLNEDGTANVFVGKQAGQSNKTNNFNSFFGNAAGANSTGDENAFFGAVTGVTNNTGNHNTLLGARANVASSALTYATAVGAGATVSASNSVVLGRTADTVRVPGTLTTTGAANVGTTLTVGGGAAVSRILTATNTTNISIVANGSNFFTIPVAGAQIGDSVSLGLLSNFDSRLIYNAFVSLTGTVTVRIFNVSTNNVSLSNSIVRETVIGF